MPIIIHLCFQIILKQGKVQADFTFEDAKKLGKLFLYLLDLDYSKLTREDMTELFRLFGSAFTNIHFARGRPEYDSVDPRIVGKQQTIEYSVYESDGAPTVTDFKSEKISCFNTLEYYKLLRFYMPTLQQTFTKKTILTWLAKHIPSAFENITYRCVELKTGLRQKLLPLNVRKNIKDALTIDQFNKELEGNPVYS